MASEAFYPKVEFIERVTIEAHAAQLIRSFCQSSGLKEIPVPIPVEDIATYLGYEFLFDDLEEMVGPGTLAAIDFKNNYIMIDNKLVPENGGNKGRYNFSIAHEIGHHREHRHLIVKDTLDLFEISTTNRIFCRNTDNPIIKKPDIEIQADYFAASLIMPRQNVKTIARDFKNFKTMYDENDRYKMIKTISDVMETSKEATEYRLTELNIIPSIEEIRDFEKSGKITLLGKG